jgi:hypothetical protein
MLLHLSYICFFASFVSYPLIANEVVLEELFRGDIDPQLKIEDGGDSKQALATIKNLPFQVGEDIRFRAYHQTMLSKVLAGHTSMKILDLKKVAGRWALGFRLEATSADWYEWAFTLRDYVQGYFDIDNNQTLYLDLNKHENSYRQSQQIEFNYNEKIIVERDTTNKRVKFKQFRLPNEVVDAYSIVYLIRRYNLADGKDINYKIYADGKVYELAAKVEGIAKIDHLGKKIPTYKVKVLTQVQGALEQRGGLFIYFSKDAAKIPIRIQGDVKIGKFILEIDDVKKP